MKEDEFYSREILRYLGLCKPYPESEAPSAHAKRVRTIERWSRIVALTILLLLVALALAHWYQPLPSWLLLGARFLGLLGLVFWIINVFTWPVASLLRFRSWNTDITDYDVRSEEYIQKITKPLLRCAPEQLKYVDARLSERFEGISGRMSIIFGEGIFKIGFLAVIFGAMDNLSKFPEQAHKFGFTVSPTFLIGAAIYLVLFFMVTPMSLKIFASRYPFQMMIIKVALDLQELQRNEVKSRFMPPGLDSDEDVDGVLGG